MKINFKKYFILPLCAIFVTAILFSCSSIAKLTVLATAIGDAAGIIDKDTADTILNSADEIIDTAEKIDAAAEQFTPEQEYYIGRAVAASILSQYKLYDNEKTQIYLNKICRTILVNSENPDLYKGYFVAILDSDEINALSTSSGHILITRGLLNVALNEDALAAVIAHEIAHIQLKHGIKAIKSSRVTEALKSTAGTALIVASEGDADTKSLVSTFDGTVGDIVSQLTVSGYSVQQEYNADEFALKLMADSGYKPEAMQEMLTALKTKSVSKEKGFGKTHPSADKRLKNLEKKYKKYSVADTSNARIQRYEENKL